MPYPYEAFERIAQVYGPVDPAKLVDTNDPTTDFMFRLLVDPAELCERWRIRFENLLRVAQAHGLLMDPAFTGRLRTRNRRRIYPVLSELEAAEFFTQRECHVEFDPPGKGARRGEFTLRCDDLTLFVEVKTVFERTLEEDRLDHRIAAVLAGIEAPFTLKIEVQNYSADFRPEHLREWLERELGAMQASATSTNTGGPPATTIEYSDRLLRVRFGVFHNPSAARLRWWQWHGGFVQTPLYVRQSIRKAYRQLPDAPNLVVIRGYLDYDPGVDDMFNALYGTEAVVFDAPDFTRSWVTRGDDGAFSPRRSRLSAVGLLKASGPLEAPQYGMDIYHSFWSRNRWNSNDLEAKSVRHFVPLSQTSVELRPELAEASDDR